MRNVEAFESLQNGDGILLDPTRHWRGSVLMFYRPTIVRDFATASLPTKSNNYLYERLVITDMTINPESRHRPRARRGSFDDLGDLGADLKASHARTSALDRSRGGAGAGLGAALGRAGHHRQRAVSVTSRI